MIKTKNINYYMDLPYNFIIQPISDESGSYFYARVLELDGCQSSGATFDEAYESIKDAMKGWLEVKLKYKDPIPEPSGDANYSGRFVVRIPKSLHRKLSIEARQEGVSLNQYAVYKLSK